MTDASLARLDALINEWLQCLHTPSGELANWTEPFSADEATCFLAGWDRGLYGIGPCLRGSDTLRFTGELFDGDEPKDAHVFGTIGNGRRNLSRELITALAAVARLHIEFHVPVAAIRLESPRLAGSGRYAVDGEVYAARRDEGQPVLGFEVKVSTREHDQLVTGLIACPGRGDEVTHQLAVLEAGGRVSTARARNHHHKCLWIVDRSGTKRFWVVSPRRSDLFAVDHVGGAFELARVDEAGLEFGRLLQAAGERSGGLWAWPRGRDGGGNPDDR